MCVTCRPIIDDKVHHGVVAWAAWRASPFTAPMALAPLSPPTLSTGTDISASLRGWWRRRHVSKRSRGGRRRMLGRSVSRGVGAPKLVRSSHPHLYLVQISAQVQPRVELQFTNIYYGNSDRVTRGGGGQAGGGRGYVSHRQLRTEPRSITPLRKRRWWKRRNG